ncbi:MAG: AMP-binding protein [Clostridiales bacterium]|nr:AMP-binding protein [Clostridiales bacterium]
MKKITNIKQMVASKAQELPDRAAFSTIVDNKLVDVTYGEFAKDVEALGEQMIKMDLKDKFIAVIGENRYEWVVPYIATVNGLGVAVPLDKELTKEEISNLLTRSNTSAFFYSEKYQHIVDYTKKNVTCVKYYICMDKPKDDSIYIYNWIDQGKKLVTKGSKIHEGLPIDEDAMSMLIYTSGTTGNPKGVMLSHRNIMTVVYGAIPAMVISEEDTALSILPIHHTYECSCGFLYMFFKGAKITFCRGLKYFGDDMKIAKPSIVMVVPLILESIYSKVIKKGGTKVKIMLKIVGFLNAIGIDIRKKIFHSIHESFGGNIRTLVSGASALNPKIAKAFDTWGFNIVQGYGLTECAPLATVNHVEYNKLSSIGLPIPGVEVKIDSPEADGIGEIIIKGDNVMIGYYKNKEETAKVVRDGWLFSGDYGRIDKDGFVYITGRKKNIIVTKNGKNIYPEEIEEVINKSDYILESVVTTKDEDILADTQIVALIVPDMDNFEEGTSKEDVESAIRDEIKDMNKSFPISKKIRDLALFDEPFQKTSTKKIKRATIGEIKYIGMV